MDITNLSILKMHFPPAIRNALNVVAVVCALTGCGPAPEFSAGAAPDADQLQPVQLAHKSEINPDQIARDVVGSVVRVADLSGIGDETEWTFEAEEFRHVDILESKTTGNTLMLVIFMTTRNNPTGDEEQVQVSGKLQLEYAQKIRQMGTYQGREPDFSIFGWCGDIKQRAVSP